MKKVALFIIILFIIIIFNIKKTKAVFIFNKKDNIVNNYKSDANLADFINFYNKEMVSYKDREKYLNLFIQSYNLLINNYVYELSNEKIKSILQSVEKSIISKETSIVNSSNHPSAKKVTQTAIETLYSSLDPHTSWLNIERNKNLQNILEGSYKGIGIVFGIKNPEDKYISIISVLDDSPAKKAGLQVGDYIYKVNGETVDYKKVNVLASLLQSNEINLQVKRKGKLKKFILTKSLINLKTVTYKTIYGKYAYIDISKFSYNTTAELRKALENLDIDEKKGLILDLRGNPGGLLYSALIVSNMFLLKGKIVSVKGRDPKLDMNYYATKDYIHTSIPMVVLINNMTASAAEIVTAALSQNHRAKVMGQQSFGKGSVQTIYNLSDGSAVKITIQLFFGPNGISLQGNGVKPDIIVNPTNKNYFYSIRETSYKNYINVKNKNNDFNKLVSKTVNESTCTKYNDPQIEDSNEIGCAIDYLQAKL